MTPVSQSLSGKHAVVTGGTRGIGAAIVELLSSHGARVSVISRSDRAQIQADITDRDSVQRAFDTAREQSGPIEILINNAGEGKSAPFLQTSADLWRQMLAVNLDGTFYCTQAALGAMLDANWGRIVNIASTAGLTGYKYISAYCAAKHGVIGLTRALALELALKGITVNAVCPGYAETDMAREAVDNIVRKTGRTPEQARADLTSRNPQSRFVSPAEVANAVLWLCLPGSEAITGQAIAVAGGEVM